MVTVVFTLYTDSVLFTKKKEIVLQATAAAKARNSNRHGHENLTICKIK